MKIDLHQLPIPDWDLVCPQCRYLLVGLPSHRCPECGLDLEMREIVRTWSRLREPRFHGTELPVPDFGLACERCDAPLAGAEAHACPFCGEPFHLPGRRPHGPWFAVHTGVIGKLPMPVVETLLSIEAIPFFTHDQKTPIEIIAGRIGGPKVKVAVEFYFDFLHAVRRTLAEIEQARRAGEGHAWRCPGCGERSPGHFELCWNCDAQRPANGARSRSPRSA